MNKPTVTYPCQWRFTLIGTEGTAIRQAVAACLDAQAYSLVPSRKSRSAKYISLHLDLEVTSERERNHLFTCLKNAPAIKMVL